MISSKYTLPFYRLCLAIFLLVLVLQVINSYPAQAQVVHPRLISPQVITDYQSGSPAWLTLKQFCDTNLKTISSPSYAGWGWRDDVENYSECYTVEKNRTPAQADLYAQKAVGLIKLMMRDHYYGTAWDSEPIGQTDGTTKTFTFSRAPIANFTPKISSVATSVVSVVYNGPSFPMTNYDKILQISNTPTGGADYAPSDYNQVWRDSKGSNYVLQWLTNNHPVLGANYYVTIASGPQTLIATSSYVRSGNNVTFTVAPPPSSSIWASYISTTYDQTGNGMGGLSSVQPDGPGYPMRTMNVGLAYAYDLMHDYVGFTTALKQEAYGILNQEVDWYTLYGYCKSCTANNYYIRGYLTGTLYTAYATEGDNPQAGRLQTLAANLIHATFASFNQTRQGGTTLDGQYAQGVASDLLGLGDVWKRITGEDLFIGTSYIDNLIPTLIHQTKPDRQTFYDLDDWSDLPATPLTGIATAFIKYLPNHAMAPYARQWLIDLGTKNIVGVTKDYKVDFPTAYFAKQTGPVLVRSSFTDPNAIWWSLSANRILDDHTRRGAGHLMLQRGKDQLAVNAADYGILSTVLQNTVLFDDQKKLIIYSPSQGVWGVNTKISKFEDNPKYVYAQADYGDAYRASSGANEVTKALRSVVNIKPNLMIVHDQAQVKTATTKKIFNINFRNLPTIVGNVLTTLTGTSKLTMTSLVPADPSAAVITPVSNTLTSSNYQFTVSGQLNDTFLHVFEITDSAALNLAKAIYIPASNGVEGALVTSGTTSWVSIFATTTTTVAGNVNYSYSPTVAGTQEQFISDLAQDLPYVITATQGGQNLYSQTIKSSTSGVLSFNFNSGSTAAVSVSITPQNVANIILTKSVDKSTAIAGDVLTYAIDYQNNGTQPAINAQVQDVVPTGLTLNGTPPNATISGSTITWNIGNLAVGAVGRVTFTATVQ